MHRLVYRYRFDRDVSPDDVESLLVLALLGTQALHGETRVRLDVRYSSDADGRRFTVDATTPAGQTLNELFAGFATRQLGDDGFKVEREVREAAAPSTEKKPTVMAEEIAA